MFYYIVDGQHRVKALKDFMEDNKCDIPVHVIVYPCQNLDEAKELFDVRNRNVMQTDYILSGDIKRDLLDEIQSTLSEVPQIFTSIKGRINRPKICLPTFMDDLGKSEWFKPIYSTEEFWEKFTRENERLALLLNDERYVKQNGITQNMKNVWCEAGIFIGVDRNFNWLR